MCIDVLGAIAREDGQEVIVKVRRGDDERGIVILIEPLFDDRDEPWNKLLNLKDRSDIDWLDDLTLQAKLMRLAAEVVEEKNLQFPITLDRGVPRAE